MIARLAGVALDARAATRTRDPGELARAARWIAGNLLAVRGIRVALDGAMPSGARVFGVRVGRLTDMLAAIAAVPALVDAQTLPVRWRLALEALGLPVLDRPVSMVLAGGASVVSAAPQVTCRLEVETSSRGYRVHLADPARTLVA